MPNSATSQRRQYRPRQPGRGSSRGEPQNDAMAVALTAQVIICILLLLLAVLMKKMDETRYSGVKAQYNVLVTDPQEGDRALAYLTENGGSAQEFFSKIESSIQSFLAKILGSPTPDQEEPAAPDDDVDEPVDPPETPAGEESTANIPTFDYNYLDTEDIVFTASQTQGIGLGQGGMFPVETKVTNLSALPAPEGSTFAPVALAGKIKPPITGLITSEFAYRYHPISGNTDFHTGMDIAAEEGRDILAALPGEVVEVGEDDIYGNYIILQHAINLRTFYAHCSEIIAVEGTAVRQGERIAKVGQTGTATGPHLHFSVIVEGKFTDPYWVLKDNITVVE